eukprot:TRINITY_DN2876_c0_g1_i1.p1 TRINITY_DN2876_c0_g1~~TRINITY_DN2876_c0_g1_i1.p1  ORF type:complete len:319 (-),score=87.34 TRINITY_DN2876_c0_g1_i1:1022-1978(-)
MRKLVEKIIEALNMKVLKRKPAVSGDSRIPLLSSRSLSGSSLQIVRGRPKSAGSGSQIFSSASSSSLTPPPFGLNSSASSPPSSVVISASPDISNDDISLFKSVSFNESRLGMVIPPHVKAENRVSPGSPNFNLFSNTAPSSALSTHTSKSAMLSSLPTLSLSTLSDQPPPSAASASVAIRSPKTPTPTQQTTPTPASTSTPSGTADDAQVATINNQQGVNLGNWKLKMNELSPHVSLGEYLDRFSQIAPVREYNVYVKNQIKPHSELVKGGEEHQVLLWNNNLYLGLGYNPEIIAKVAASYQSTVSDVVPLPLLVAF